MGEGVLPFVDLLSKLGLGGVIALAFIGFQQGWWIFGRESKVQLEAKDRELQAKDRELQAMAKDRDQWQARAEALTYIGERYRQAVIALPPPPALPAAPGGVESQ